MSNERIEELETKVRRLEYAMQRLLDHHPKIKENVDLLNKELDSIPKIHIEAPKNTKLFYDWKKFKQEQEYNDNLDKKITGL